MTCFYIEESKEKNKYKLKLHSIFNAIKIKEDKIILPISENQNLSNKKAKKFAEKIKKENIKIVALSENLEKKQNLKNELYANNINIIDGKYLFKLLIEEVIRYICKNRKTKEEETSVAILINDVSSINKQIILNLAEKVKTINVVTNHINEFKTIEDYLYNEKGIIIKVSNNKQKDLLKSDININMDFSEETINKYNICSNGIIVNMNNEIKIKTKKFNGINVNNYNIIIPSKYKRQGFNNKIVYESKILNLDYNKACKEIKKDKIKMKNLIGEKGIIDEREFAKT